MCLPLFIKWIFAANIRNSLADFFFFIFKIRYAKEYIFCDFIHIILFEASCCYRRSAKANTACNKGLLGVIGNRIFVGCYVNFIKARFKLFAGDAGAAKVNKDKMVIRAAADKIYSS